MKTLFVVLPLLLGMLILLYTIISNLLRVWLAHRVKMALLERLQHDISGFGSDKALQSLLELPPDEEGVQQKLDYLVVGIVLLVIGLITALVGYVWGQGANSVAVYFGGIVCIVVGAILILLGMLIRYLARLPVDGNL